MFLLVALLVWHVAASVCDVSKNNPVLNEDCNYAGSCVEFDVIPGLLTDTVCVCCAPEHIDDDNICGDYWTCDMDNPTVECLQFTGDKCEEVTSSYYVNIGFRALNIIKSEPYDFICTTDPRERALNQTYGGQNFYYHEQVRYVFEQRGWPGSVKYFPPCDVCTIEYPCQLGSLDVNADEGIGSPFQVDLTEYYGCYNPGILGWQVQIDDMAECPSNYDRGQHAHKVWSSVIGDIKDQTILDELNVVLSAEPDEFDNHGAGWSNTEVVGVAVAVASRLDTQIIVLPTLLPTTSPSDPPTPMPSRPPTKPPTPTPTRRPTDIPSIVPSLSPTTRPTRPPTPRPTPLPTVRPTMSPIGNDCSAYTNTFESLKFLGVGSNCRAGLDVSYIGGQSCDSPYIVCLPQENTPAYFAGLAYHSTTHRYSVSECIQECANDQRCLGIEFVADVESNLGDCNLIDDIPVEINSVASSFEYDFALSYGNLDISVTNGTALCFEKGDFCNPYFEADDLNEDMLDCYCPNNRKGFYTKKVKRTVNNTRFCGDDNDVERRLQKAQANRMFHLCENWCLFETENPEGESWYYDPWQTCWREQYTGYDMHMSYCSRVIRDPNTIEMQYINYRKNNFC